MKIYGQHDERTVQQLERCVAAEKGAVGVLCADGHVGMEAGPLRGIDALKFQTLNALSNLRGRLQQLQNRPPSKPELPALQARKGLRKLMELCGYKVTVAHTGREGLEAAQRTRPDIVLCDIGLPDTDGYQLAAALRTDPATAQARLIAVTAYGSEHDKRRSREAGFQLHLVKPVKPENLLEELDKPVKTSHCGGT